MPSTRNTDPIDMPSESQDSVPHPRSPAGMRRADSTAIRKVGGSAQSAKRAANAAERARQRENDINIAKQIQRGKAAREKEKEKKKK